MSPPFAYLCTIAIFVSILAVGVSVANLLHFRKTERRLREDPDAYLKEVLRRRDANGQTGEGDLW